ncbi:MAG: tetratricopeptide repeat protein [Saprospiraceae bacterium]|nr:tetratricopeptide repeat protein [Saprospiraceae bacterium]MBK8295954.1 tetratricopeptide repeat protein [Saprospiraceae bacterium]
MSMLNRKVRILTMLESDPENDFLLFALAKELENEKLTEEAINTYRQLIRIHPKYIGTYYHLAKILQFNLNTEEAILVLKNGIDQAKALKDLHALAEMQNLLNDIEMEDLM